MILLAIAWFFALFASLVIAIKVVGYITRGTPFNATFPAIVACAAWTYLILR